jgi:hypothetical protein
LLTQVRVSGSYLIPKAEVQASLNFQNLPGPAIAANFLATNAVVQQSLQRNLAGGAANTTVNLVAPGQMYGDRVNQLDLRLSRVLKFRQTRTALTLDVFNLLNSHPILTQNNAFAGPWQTPLSILQSRFAKIGVNVDF